MNVIATASVYCNAVIAGWILADFISVGGNVPFIGISLGSSTLMNEEFRLKVACANKLKHKTRKGRNNNFFIAVVFTNISEGKRNDKTNVKKQGIVQYNLFIVFKIKLY